jgi:hypothetical protein
VVSNIEEGYKRPTTKEYLDFLGFSQASLEEVRGLIKQVHQDRFLKSKPDSKLSDLGIDLEEIKGKLKESKGEVLLEILYSPLRSFKGTNLTLEMFLELINKTDWLFRRLVDSLEKKMAQEIPMSPRERWLKTKMLQKLEEEKVFVEKLKKKMGIDNIP